MRAARVFVVGALGEWSWLGVAEMEPGRVAGVLGVYAQRVITPRRYTAVSGLELMTPLCPPTRAVRGLAKGSWVSGRNPGSLGRNRWTRRLRRRLPSNLWW